MNKQTIPLPRLFSRTKRHAAPQPERVEGVYLQEKFIGPVLPQAERPAAEFLAEHQDDSGSATLPAAFIP